MKNPLTFFLLFIHYSRKTIQKHLVKVKRNFIILKIQRFYKSNNYYLTLSITERPQKLCTDCVCVMCLCDWVSTES